MLVSYFNDINFNFFGEEEFEKDFVQRQHFFQYVAEYQDLTLSSTREFLGLDMFACSKGYKIDVCVKGYQDDIESQTVYVTDDSEDAMQVYREILHFIEKGKNIFEIPSALDLSLKMQK